MPNLPKTLSFQGMPVIKAACLRVGRLLGLVLCVGLVSVPVVAQAAPQTTTAKKPAAKSATKSAVRTSAVRRTSTRTTAATRRARAARATAALKARQLREAQVPQYKLDDSGALVPDLRAEAAIIYD